MGSKVLRDVPVIVDRPELVETELDLVRLGVLGLGANETLHLTPKERRYRLLDETGRLYRRID